MQDSSQALHDWQTPLREKGEYSPASPSSQFRASLPESSFNSFPLSQVKKFYADLLLTGGFLTCNK